MLTRPTLAKLGKKCLGRSPERLEVRDDEIAATREQIRLMVQPIDWVHWDDKPDGYRKNAIASFQLRDPDSESWRADSFWVLRDGNQLQMQAGFHENIDAPISTLEEIEQFVRECKANLERQRALRIKRSRIKTLKHEAILAAIKRIAVLDGFDFTTEMLTPHVNLYVRIHGDRCILLRIPYKAMESTLPKIRPIIAKLRELSSEGVSFEITGVPWRARKSWYLHKDLPRPEDEEEERDGDSD